MKTRPCIKVVPADMDGVYPATQVDCPYPAMKGKRMCSWHWLARQPASVQEAHADARLQRWVDEMKEIRRHRVPKEEWPVGERWCSGCQSFVPLFYTSGSRCRACASRAAHAGRVESTYGITEEEYQTLLRAQKGRCYICHRIPRTKRLAVDHDHATGAVRGLLCASNENGCNRGVVANLETAPDGGLEAAKRAVLYLAKPPWQRVQEGRGYGWERFLREELARIESAKEDEPVAYDGFGAPIYQHPPF